MKALIKFANLSASVNKYTRSATKKLRDANSKAYKSYAWRGSNKLKGKALAAAKKKHKDTAKALKFKRNNTKKLTDLAFGDRLKKK